METTTFLVVAVAILGFGLVSGRLRGTIVTPPMVFVLAGLLAGPYVTGLVELGPSDEAIHVLAELTLLLVLFTDASRIDLGLLRREHGLPVRLLVVGLPLTIVLGALIAPVLCRGLTFWEGAVLAAILAPTDAALGQAVVANRDVPVRIRQTLNVESGLNDGICVPVVLILVSVAAMGGGPGPGEWVAFAVAQVTLGPLAGLAVGAVGGWLVLRAARSGWMSETFQSLAALGLALLAFGAAEQIGGNGLIAAFCAGLAVGNFSRPICGKLYAFGEAEGQLLGLLVFLAFGAALVPEALAHLSWRGALYALLSLTVIRLLPVALSLVGARLAPVTVLFLGWFGPRGLASIVFALLVIETSRLPGRHELLMIVVVTVLASVFAHGMTAAPLSRVYARRIRREAAAGGIEHHPVTEMPLRLSAGTD